MKSNAVSILAGFRAEFAQILNGGKATAETILPSEPPDDGRSVGIVKSEKTKALWHLLGRINQAIKGNFPAGPTDSPAVDDYKEAVGYLNLRDLRDAVRSMAYSEIRSELQEPVPFCRATIAGNWQVYTLPCMCQQNPLDFFNSPEAAGSDIVDLPFGMVVFRRSPRRGSGK